MAGHKDYGREFCNYCGVEVESWRSAINHVVENHVAEVYVGPGEYDPARRARGVRIQIIGPAVSLSVLGAICVFQFLTDTVLSSIQGLMMVVTTTSLLAGSILYGEYYGKKGLRPEPEIIMDLHIPCDVCGQRIARRDEIAHTEAHHPEEHALVRRVYTPLAWVSLSAVILGFAGLGAALMTVDAGYMSEETGTALAVVSGIVLAAGFVSLSLFEYRYHRPRMERLARERSERNLGKR